MERSRPTPAPRVRRSREERKRETREALTMAAMATFARDGYHGASLEGIAGEAGFSKGAVYSNFGGKAELFLAVMDYSLETLRGGDWDPFARPEAGAACAPDAVQEETEAAEMMHGFGLATLEFITTAIRDATLIESLRTRVQMMVGAYERVAGASRAPGEDLPPGDIAHLMTALEQGVSLLVLSGLTSVDGALLRTGLRRLLDPVSAADDPSPPRDRPTAHLPDVDRIRRLMHEEDSDP